MTISLFNLDFVWFLACDCSPYGSVRTDCEQMSGKCICKPGISGERCNICPDGSPVTPKGCNGCKIRFLIHSQYTHHLSIFYNTQHTYEKLGICQCCQLLFMWWCEMIKLVWKLWRVKFQHSKLLKLATLVIYRKIFIVNLVFAYEILPLSRRL